MSALLKHEPQLLYGHLKLHDRSRKDKIPQQGGLSPIAWNQWYIKMTARDSHVISSTT